MKISVVIPAHNEENTVEKMVNLLMANFKRYINEIVIVNDCSSDNTGKILEKIKNKNKIIKPVHRKKDGGVGNAIREGLKNVSATSTHVLLLDCDFLENTQNIKTMISNASDADGLIGSRFIKGEQLKNYPRFKKFANRSFHLLAKIALWIPHIIDVTNNFKLYKREIIDSILPHLKSSGFSINAETGIYPHLLGYKLKEIPVVWIGRSEDMGSSKFNIIKAGPGYFLVFIYAFRLKFLIRNHGSGKARFLPNKDNLSSQESEKRHFNTLIDKIGETYYGNLRPVAKIRFTRKAETILQGLRNVRNPKILEYGCGTGILSKYLLTKQPNLSIRGIDISPKAIQIAKKTLKKYKNANFQAGDALQLPYKSNSFDMVVGNSILHHLPLEQALTEIKRVLKPNGKIWFCEPNILNPQIALEKNIPFFKSYFQDSKDETAYTRWGIKKKLEKSGFNNVKALPYEFLHPLLPTRLLKTLVWFCIFLEKVPFIRELAGTIQIVGVKKDKTT